MHTDTQKLNFPVSMCPVTVEFWMTRARGRSYETANYTMPTRPRLAAAVAAVGVVLVLLLVPAVLCFRPITARDATLMTGQCHMLNGLTEVVIAILMYRLGSKLISEHLLPLWFAMLHASNMHDAETLEERRWITKISELLLSIAVRTLCFFLLLPGWSFFSFEVGLELNTTTPSGRCNLESDGVGAARAFYTSRYLLCSLMIYELLTASKLHWSVLAHHVGTMVACAVTTDTVLLSIVGGKVRGAAADGVGFVTFFYAALTAFETALVLAYHLNAGNRPR